MCPYCNSPRRQVKSGFNRSGSQRFLCRRCDRIYTPSGEVRGGEEQLRLYAVYVYHEGWATLRGLADTLNCSPQTILNWVRAYEHYHITLIERRDGTWFYEKFKLPSE